MSVRSGVLSTDGSILGSASLPQVEVRMMLTGLRVSSPRQLSYCGAIAALLGRWLVSLRTQRSPGWIRFASVGLTV